ncbi:hypothetical protein J2I47_00895 [Fibrella sp. HMF5335]|uniref:Uncharacterized protein n=1 Tax=Fibrella rubiginis TaxID=2817060 RepID=A0A939GE79_9BACT|nr:hypothetical protein [Fibrella rubiginis]MBO0935091.1 hypothetical protein [Fibrella rubiginis]
MTALAKNYDGICFQLRHYPSAQSDAQLKSDLDRLTSEISALVRSKRKIRPQSVMMLGQVFNLRVKALIWFAANRSLTLSDMFEGNISRMEELKSSKRLEFLFDNILFALRCNQRVAESLAENGVSDGTPLPITPDITYSQFVTSIALASIDDRTGQKIVDFTNASLHIEFGLFAADIINDEKASVADSTINELAFLIADAAQNYVAIATELGLLKPRSIRNPIPTISLDSDFIDEQKELADSGLDEFALNFAN